MKSMVLVRLKASEITTAATAVKIYNAGLSATISNLTRYYPDVEIIPFDSHSLFQSVLEDPAAYPETARYWDTSTYCLAYEILSFTQLTGPSDWNIYLPTCQYPVDEYLWFNYLHPTYPLHNVTARYIAAALG